MDHKRVIQPGEDIQIQAAGDFLFLKSATAPVVVSIGGDPVTMVAGGKRRPAGGFDGFEVRNDNGNPVVVVFVVGRGDYNEQIVRGEITINPGIRGEDGVFVDDTRYDLTLRVALSNLEKKEYHTGSVVYSIENLATYAFTAGAVIKFKDTIKIIVGSNNSIDTFLLDKSGKLQDITSVWTADNKYSCEVPAGVMCWKKAPLKNNLGLAIVDKNDFQIKSNTDTGLSRVNSGSGHAMAYDADSGFVFASTSDNVVKASAEGKVITSIPLPANGPYNAVLIRNGLVHFTGGTSSAGESKALFDTNLMPVDMSMWAVPTTADGAPSVYWASGTDKSGRCFFGLSTTNQKTLYQVATLDWTQTATGSVSSCGGARLFNTTGLATDAQISSRIGDAGKVIVSGQVIKAVLDIYFREKFAPADYLDHIYAVKFDEANGVIPLEKRSGGSSFKRAGIEDMFNEVPLPQTITITADAKLKPE